MWKYQKESDALEPALTSLSPYLGTERPRRQFLFDMWCILVVALLVSVPLSRGYVYRQLVDGDEENGCQLSTGGHLANRESSYNNAECEMTTCEGKNGDGRYVLVTSGCSPIQIRDGEPCHLVTSVGGFYPNCCMTVSCTEDGASE